MQKGFMAFFYTQTHACIKGESEACPCILIHDNVLLLKEGILSPGMPIGRGVMAYIRHNCAQILTTKLLVKVGEH